MVFLAHTSTSSNIRATKVDCRVFSDQALEDGFTIFALSEPLIQEIARLPVPAIDELPIPMTKARARAKASAARMPDMHKFHKRDVAGQLILLVGQEETVSAWS